ncbi:hypothetical protein V5J35_004850 [Endozoicomonas sp. NE40]|uniref:Uncharacterized protein n=1 Tax=Endozoicomonas lisbonensis TaxID=3120522 RepID=A0ABV2SP58_9GAMM
MIRSGIVKYFSSMRSILFVNRLVAALCVVNSALYLRLIYTVVTGWQMGKVAGGVLAMTVIVVTGANAMILGQVRKQCKELSRLIKGKSEC